MALFKELETQGVKLFKYRGTLPIIILVAALILFAYEKSCSSFICSQTDLNEISNNFSNKYYFKFICLAVSLLGLFVRIHTLGFVKPNTSGRNTSKQIADGVNKTGMYSLLRHPLYLGNFLMWLGIGMLTENIWFNLFFILGFWIYYERIMFAEESYLIKKFGDEYSDWSESVPPFIPSFRDYKKPELDFAWRKIIRQEKSGIAALFTVFMIFHQIEFYLTFGGLDLTASLWNVLFLIFGVYLVVIKLLHKNTSWLDRCKTR